MADAFEFKDGVYGRRAVLQTDWAAGMARFLSDNAIVELELNMAKGWKAGSSVSFLADLPFLESFEIFDFLTKDISPIHSLVNLRRLGITTYCSTPIDFSAFPVLESCGLEWRPKATSLFERTTLKDLFINRYKGQDCDPFAKFVNLESLGILNAPVKNLHGLGKLAKLRSLRLARLTTLQSLEGLEHLENLVELNIQTCRKLSSLAPLASLRKLKKLHVNNCGDIDSLAPLADMDLEWVTLDESTNILDGDISPLARQKRLSIVGFKHRKHYTHTTDDLGRLHGG